MDRFSISLEGYHELTQVEKTLPRTYLIESYTKVLDSKWEVTNGTVSGKLLMYQVPSVKVFRYKITFSRISPNMFEHV